MNKYFFISSSWSARIVLLLFIFWFFSFYLVFMTLFSFLFIYLFLFRRKRIETANKNLIEPNLVASPISGQFIERVDQEDHIELVFKVNPWNNYGVYMPVAGEITDYAEREQEIQTTIMSKFGKDIKLKFCNVLMRKANIFTRSGDRGILGGTLGYLPFGGKVVIELPVNTKILIKEGDNVLSFQTLLASFKEN